MVSGVARGLALARTNKSIGSEHIRRADAAGLAEAVSRLEAGKVVAFPTETVYGLGADAARDEAVEKIYRLKGRPRGNPLIVHVLDVEMARACVLEFPPAAEILAKAFWPGPLTLVLRRGRGLSRLVSAGLSTVAIRCPSHRIARALIRRLGSPIAAPSANRYGQTSPTTAEHVYAEFHSDCPLILDGGACQVGLESTVLDLTGSQPVVLRPGAITPEMIQHALKRSLEAGSHVISKSLIVPRQSAAPSPGLARRHYAPRTTAYRFPRKNWGKIRAWIEKGRGREPVVLISHDTRIALGEPNTTIVMPDDDVGYAKRLYAALRQADHAGCKSILVLEPQHKQGLWPAVIDRLARATEEVPL